MGMASIASAKSGTSEDGMCQNNTREPFTAPANIAVDSESENSLQKDTLRGCIPRDLSRI